MIAVVAMLPLPFGCGNAQGGMEAGADGAIDGAADVRPDAWWAMFDARFDPELPPLPGEYPGERYKCMDGKDCYGTGNCNPTSGWCCFGREQLGTAVCKCGATLGCAPPQVCCAEPGDLLPHCVASLVRCTSDGGKVW